MNPWQLPDSLAELEHERQLAALESAKRRARRWARLARKDARERKEAKGLQARDRILYRKPKLHVSEERVVSQLRALERYAQAADLEDALDLPEVLDRAVRVLERAKSERRSALKAALLLAV